MLKVCESLNIKVNKVFDAQQKEIEIAGSVEVKGIKGTDKRNYLVDLQGLNPRDSNYKGDEFHTCLLRPELLIIYQRNHSIEATQKQMEEFKKKFEVLPEDLKEKSEEEKEEIMKKRQL
jgi:hypothetical protein